jgi:plastocyanin
MKRLLVLTPFALVALAAPAHAGGGCFSGEPAPIEAADTIKIDHACLFPAAARVAVGAKVTWINSSELPHNLSGPAIEFTDLPVGAKHSVTFAKAGIYPYACMLHPGMSGVVVVGDVGLPAAAVQPVASKADDGGTSVVPWIVAGVLVLVASGAVVTFARREGRVPVPAR